MREMHAILFDYSCFGPLMNVVLMQCNFTSNAGSGYDGTDIVEHFEA